MQNFTHILEAKWKVDFDAKYVNGVVNLELSAGSVNHQWRGSSPPERLTDERAGRQ